MSPQKRALIYCLFLIGVVVVLAALFPPVLAFVEMGAREIRYLWWVILLFALGVWLIWGIGKKPKQ